MTAMLFGFMHEGSSLLDESQVAALAEVFGPNRIARVMANWNMTTNPSRGVFNLTTELANVKLLRKYGYKILLGTLWAPPWASEGAPTYCQYFDGCTLMDGKTFTPEREHCSNPRHIDKEAKYEWSRVLAQACDDEGVEFAADWNEPGGWGYWPPMSLGDQQAALRRLRDESVVPFTQAFRAHAPNTKLIGIEAQGGDEVIRLMGLEAEYFAKYGVQLYDEIGVHYPQQEPGKWDYYAMACGNFHDYEDRRAYKGRPWGITEGGYDDWPMTVAEIKEAIRRKCWCYIGYDFGTSLLTDGKLNDRARELQAIIAEQSSITTLGGFLAAINARLATQSKIRRPGSQLAHDVLWLKPDADYDAVMKQIDEIDHRFTLPVLGKAKELK